MGRMSRLESRLLKKFERFNLKQCKKCGIVMNRSKFYKASRNKDGLDTQCKQCRKKTARQYKNAL